MAGTKPIRAVVGGGRLTNLIREARCFRHLYGRLLLQIAPVVTVPNVNTELPATYAKAEADVKPTGH